MRYASFDIGCEFTAPARTSAYKGSALRGMFGRALKRVACALRRRDCRGCMLSGNCVYVHLFESLPVKRVGSRPPTPVHPYVIFPELREQRNYATGDTFSFQVILFGDRALESFPHLVCAVNEMGGMGFGRRGSDCPGTFRMISVRQEERELLTGEGALQRPAVQSLSMAETPAACDSIRVHFRTPFRVKLRNRLQERPEFHLLVRAALRRVSELEEMFAAGEPSLDYRGLVSRAEGIKSVINGCGWQEMVRNSSRQKRLMNYGGIVGTAIYEGDLAEYLPLLRYCEVVHLGKLTAFGLGRIEIEAGQ